MNYYLVVHDVPSFQQHEDWIGRSAKTVPPDFRALRRGDGIVYYCKEDLVITGTFKVASAPRVEITSDSSWKGSHVVVTIEPVAKAEPPRYVCVRQMLEELPEPLSIFPARKVSGIKLRGKTFVPITKADFRAISKYIPTYRPAPLFNGPSNDQGLGKWGNLGAMSFAPTSEQGVVALFVWHMRTLGFEHLEFIRQGFPDACAIEAKGATNERKYVEFEYRASLFRQHVNNPKHRQYRCDYVVCWENDYPTCPVPVIELKTRIDWALPHQERPTAVHAAPPAPEPQVSAKPVRKRRPAKAVEKPTRRRAAPSGITMADLIRLEKLVVGQELRLDWKGKQFTATVQGDGSVLFNGKTYATPSAAGQAARNGLSTNGWVYWKCFDGQKWVVLSGLRRS